MSRASETIHFFFSFASGVPGKKIRHRFDLSLNLLYFLWGAEVGVGADCVRPEEKEEPGSA